VVLSGFFLFIRPALCWRDRLSGLRNLIHRPHMIRDSSSHSASDPQRLVNAREKQLKKWRREKKIALIDAANPEWLDLSGEVH
jgi:hypothetical protein